MQIVYWLALATWFGGVVFVALSAPVVFNTVRQSNPILPRVLSVNVEDQHATLLDGTIVGNLIAPLVPAARPRRRSARIARPERARPARAGREEGAAADTFRNRAK